MVLLPSITIMQASNYFNITPLVKWGEMLLLIWNLWYQTHPEFCSVLSENKNMGEWEKILHFNPSLKAK